MDKVSQGISNIIKSFVDQGETAGANVLVFKDGSEAAYGEYGFRDIENGTPFSRDTIFRLYSQTKPITAAATILLASQGLLDLTSNLSEYFPEYSEMFINDKKGRRLSKKQITVQDLLNMSAGLSYPDGNTECGKQSETFFKKIESQLYDKNSMTTMDFARQAAELDLCFTPGTHFRYGICADILGALIERITGKSFGDFLRKNFFAPLNMSDTDFFVTKEKSSRLAKAYSFVNNRPAENPTDFLGNIYARDRQPSFESGGAGLVSTVDDYMNFANMLMQNGIYGKTKVMGKSAVDFLTKGGDKKFARDLQTTFNWMRGYTYGNLMRYCVDYNESAIIASEGEYGWDGWMGSFFSNDPKNKISLVIGVQVPGVQQMGTMARRIKNYVTSELS